MSNKFKNTSFKAEIWPVYARFLKLTFKNFKFLLIIFLTTILINSFFPFAINFINAQILDQLAIGLNTSGNSITLRNVQLFIILFFVFHVLSRVFSEIEVFLEKKFYLDWDIFIRKLFASKYNQLDPSHFEDKQSLEIIHNAKDTYLARSKGALDNTIWSFHEISKLTLSIITVLSFSKLYFLVIILFSSPLIISRIYLGKKEWKIWDTNVNDRHKFGISNNSMLLESNQQDKKILGIKDYLENYVFSIFSKLQNYDYQNLKRRFTYNILLNNLAFLGLFVFWVSLIDQTIKSEITLGQLTFYFSSVIILKNAFLNFSQKLTNIYHELLYVKDFFTFLDIKPKITSGNAKPKGFEIEFKNAKFQYTNSTKNIFNNLNLKIKEGQKIAIVGANGSGKSTLVKLITRTYSLTGGQLYLGDEKIENVDHNFYFSNLSCLFQEYSKFTFLTVRENINLGKINTVLDDEKIKYYLKNADALDFINKLPNGLDQILTKSLEGGVMLSGGEWQKLVIARILSRDTQLLILDEPTSAIDARSEEKIFTNLYETFKEKTIIIVSHRFSTVRKADRIIVLSNGEIIEDGNHEELMQLKGEYAKSFSLQAKGYN